MIARIFFLLLLLTALPGPAWVLLSKTFKPFRPTDRASTYYEQLPDISGPSTPKQEVLVTKGQKGVIFPFEEYEKNQSSTFFATAAQSGADIGRMCYTCTVISLLPTLFLHPRSVVGKNQRARAQHGVAARGQTIPSFLLSFFPSPPNRHVAGQVRAVFSLFLCKMLGWM